MRFFRKKKKTEIKWEKASDIQEEITDLICKLKLDHISEKQIICFRSFGSNARARARIWSFPRVWQLALNLPPHYVIEVLSENYDHLSSDDRKRVLIHELMHIPKTFSGSLVNHRGRFHAINRHTVEALFREYKKSI